jgi:hypothetical protein
MGCQHRGLKVKGSEGRFVSAKIVSQLGIPKNVYTKPYLLHAYGISRSTLKNCRIKADQLGEADQLGNN